MKEERRFIHLTAAPEFARRIILHDLVRLRHVGRHEVWASEGADLAGIRAEGFETVALPIHRKLSPWKDLFTIANLWSRFRAVRPDVVHSYTAKAGLVGQIAGWLARVKCRLHSVRGLLYTPGMPRWRRWLFRMTDYITFRLAHRVLFVSSADRDYCVETGLCPASKAVYTGNGIDLSLFDRSAIADDRRAAVRSAWGATSDSIVVLSVGRYVVDKGYRELAEAIRIAVASCPGARFVWIAPVLTGESGTLPDDFIEKQGLSTHVMRLGLQDDMPALYAAADVLVHPSHREGVPRAIMEAGAMGLAVVATDIPGNREVIDDTQVGWLAQVGDVQRLAEHLIEVIENSGEREQRAGALQRRVKASFSQDAVSQKVAAVYRDLMGE